MTESSASKEARRARRQEESRAGTIALHEEQKQAIIQQAVTGQIDVRTGQPYPAHKDSGVEWLGEVPEHWEVRKLTRVARQETGHTPSRKVDAYWVPEECVIPWVSLADVWQLRSGEVVFIEETKERVSEVGLANSAARLLPKDTVILPAQLRLASPLFSVRQWPQPKILLPGFAGRGCDRSFFTSCYSR